jgi:hypothetical protein
MLEAKTEEQREHVENIVKKYMIDTHYCQFLDVNVYRNYKESVEISLKCDDCDSLLYVDVLFDMMAEIVDYLRSVNKSKKSELDMSIVAPNMVEPVKTWLAYKKEKGQSYKPTGFKTFYKKLCELSGNNPQVAMAIIEQSMQNNYAGIFPLRNNNNNYGRETITDKIRRTVEEANIFSQQLTDRIGNQADVCDGDNTEIW